MATVTIFSGETGSQRKAKYADDTAIIQPIWKKLPIPNSMYDQPLVISHAKPKQSKSRGLNKKRAKVIKNFLILRFFIYFSICNDYFVLLLLCFMCIAKGHTYLYHKKIVLTRRVEKQKV